MAALVLSLRVGFRASSSAISIVAEASTVAPTIIDGDSLEVAGERIRLHGIDAPERRQLCLIDGKRWQWGRHAANILADFISSRTVKCKDLGRNR